MRSDEHVVIETEVFSIDREQPSAVTRERDFMASVLLDAVDALLHGDRKAKNEAMAFIFQTAEQAELSFGFYWDALFDIPLKDALHALQQRLKEARGGNGANQGNARRSGWTGAGVYRALFGHPQGSTEQYRIGRNHGRAISENDVPKSQRPSFARCRTRRFKKRRSP